MVRFSLLNLDIAGSGLSLLSSNLSLCMVAGLEVTSGEKLGGTSDKRGDVGIATLNS